MKELLSDRLLCGRCGKVMAKVTREEFDGITQGEDWSGLCFDCDPESASTTPSIFWQWQEGDVFSLGGELHEVQSNSLWPFSRAHERAHERGRARGLSSYTYLNKTPKNRAFLGDGVELAVCLRCKGRGGYPEGEGEVMCIDCEGHGAIESAILIPAWILGLGCENAR